MMLLLDGSEKDQKIDEGLVTSREENIMKDGKYRSLTKRGDRMVGENDEHY